MNLSLSVRIAEAFDNKERSNLPFPEILALARKYGFRAVCMRASVAGVHTPVEVVRDLRRQLDEAGLRVSMVTGDFAVPSNNDSGPDLLRYIRPHLDLATELKATLIRVCMKREEDIYWAQRAADEAAERGIRLAHQSHIASLFEVPENALKTLRAVGRSNFGLIYEPANWFICGQAYGAEILKQFEPYLFNVYVQNHRVRPQGASPLQSWTKGEIRVDHIGIWEAGGVDYPAVLRALKNLKYTGYVTVHQAFAGVMPVEEAVRRSAEYLKQFLS
ncbi:MAG: sugar phosphate isomerase/epimerase [Bryobacteraceae bacterium]|nr:sugar phosphate isomerase/epimerase [Bryobacteraceae bacterium]MDW8377554.1 sugar phosphate isomerase/epimerase [Bryobacterales bacterium]